MRKYYNNTIIFRADTETKRQLEELSAINKVPISEYLRNLIKKPFEENAKLDKVIEAIKEILDCQNKILDAMNLLLENEGLVQTQLEAIEQRIEALEKQNKDKA